MSRKMLPVVRLERLQVFNCDQCPFVSHEPLVIQYHLIIAHYQDFKQEAQELVHESDDEDLLATEKKEARKRPVVIEVKKKPERPQRETFECVFCDEAFESKDLLKKHLLQVHVQGVPAKAMSSSVQCCICALRFDSDAVLVLHLRKVHSISAAEAKDIVDEQLGLVEPGPDLVEADPVEPPQVSEKRENESFDENKSDDENFEDAPDDGGDDDGDDEDYIPEGGIEPEDVEFPDNELDTAAETSLPDKRPSKGKKQEVSNVSNKWDKCLKCDTTLDGTLSDAASHHKLFHKRSSECFLCQKVLAGASNARRHLTSSHGFPTPRGKPAELVSSRRKKNKKERQCPKCDKMFTSIFSLAKHLKRDHGEDQLGIVYFSSS